jgi:hypothetical protein
LGLVHLVEIGRDGEPNAAAQRRDENAELSHVTVAFVLAVIHVGPARRHGGLCQMSCQSLAVRAGDEIGKRVAAMDALARGDVLHQAGEPA